VIDGVDLSLMIGPAVPLPVPRVVIDALESVQVTNASGDTPSGFELKFSLLQKSHLDVLIGVAGGAMPPIVRVVIYVTVQGSAQVLIDGVMTHYELGAGENGGLSLVVKGKDLSAVMDVIELDGIPYPAMPPVLRALTVLAKYAVLGVIPMTIPSIVEDIPIPVERIPRQQGTDYAYVTMLARQCGYVFYFEPGPFPGTSRAYWGPEIKLGTPQPALNTDMDLFTNVESLSFRFDKESKELPVVFIQNKETKLPIPIPIPDITPLNPPLGLVPPLPPKLTFLTDTAKQSPLSAVMTGLAYASTHADCVSATGSLDVVRYGHILKSRALVGVRGAGVLFDGLYYVRSVTHDLKRGVYKQSFELARNGLVSTVPSVPT
jgi:hypothetical protein